MLTLAPSRPAWIEIDLDQLRKNFALIRRDKPAGVEVLSVVKDEAYGHGAFAVARVAMAAGISRFAVVTLDEALHLRERGVRAPILMLGERQPFELRCCLENDLTVCLSDAGTVTELARCAQQLRKRAAVHVKIDTGMSRYGVRWNEAPEFIRQLLEQPALELEGLLSHFAMSDENDKTFALLQLSRFKRVLGDLAKDGIRIPQRHLCNSGGLLDLPQAHFEMVRIGILPLGVYPSKVCRRIAGIEPVMRVKARIAAVQSIEPGDNVGYGLRYTASSRRRIAVLPIGYGDGFPRVRNQGDVLIRGRRAPLVGSVSMDALTVDITDIPEAQLWDETVIMGKDGAQEISVHDLARLKNSVSYDVLAGWRSRLPRIYLGGQ